MQLNVSDKSHYLRFVRRLNLPVLQTFPVDAPKEGVILDVPLFWRIAASQSLYGILYEQLQHQSSLTQVQQLNDIHI